MGDRAQRTKDKALCFFISCSLLFVLGFLFFFVLCFPPVWICDIGQSGDTRFVDGFFLPERESGVTFRWSGPKARLLLHGAGVKSFTLDMRIFSASSTAAEDSQHLRLVPDTRQDNQAVADFALPATGTWRIYRVLIPAHAVVDAGGNTIPLKFQHATYRPGRNDGRDLGVPVDWIRPVPMKTATVSLGGPLLRALLIVWGLGIFAAILLRLDTTPAAYWQHPRRRVLSVYLPFTGVAAALLWWTWSNPYTLAWTLPSIPWSLALVTLLLIVWGRNAGFGSWEIVEPSDGSFIIRRSSLILLLIFLLALGLRLYRIDNLPYGLWRDEARHGMIALRMLEDPSYRPVYIARDGVNMPAAGLYPFALALQALGIHAWSMRVVTALAGALTIFPLYGLVYGLFRQHTIALLAAAFLAVSSWHLSISRYSFPTVFDPLLTLTGLWLLLRGLQVPGTRYRETGAENQIPGISRRDGFFILGAWLLSGFCLGLALQTYHTGRVAPVLALLLALLVCSGNAASPPDTISLDYARHWRAAARRCSIGALGIVAFALTITPLISYALRYPNAFQDRVGEVFLLSEGARRGNAPLHVLDESLGRHILMFHVYGDSNGRHHAPDRPLLDPVMGMGMLAGIAVALMSWRNWRNRFLLMALIITLLPSLLAVEGPHAMRGFGAVPWACTIAALGWVQAISHLQKQFRRGWVQCVALSGVIVLALLLNAWTYFGIMAVDPRVWQAFYPVHTQIGTYLRDITDQQGRQGLAHVYVPAELADNPVFLYLTDGLPVQKLRLQTASSYHLPVGTQLVLSGYTYARDIAQLRPLVGSDPIPTRYGPFFPGTNTPSFLVYQTP